MGRIYKSAFRFASDSILLGLVLLGMVGAMAQIFRPKGLLERLFDRLIELGSEQFLAMVVISILATVLWHRRPNHTEFHFGNLFLYFWAGLGALFAVRYFF